MLFQKALLVLVSSRRRRALSLRAVHSGLHAAFAVIAVAAVPVVAVLVLVAAVLSVSLLLLVSCTLPAEPVACLSQSF
jgi:hypothetical protein